MRLLVDLGRQPMEILSQPPPVGGLPAGNVISHASPLPGLQGVALNNYDVRGGPISTYVLVHARWHGAWCWDRTAARPRQAGHTVITPNRAGVDQIRELVEARTESVILFGHSSSGTTVSAVAELAPRRVRLPGYVSAFLLANRMIPLDIAREDTDSVLREHLMVDEERQTITVSEPEQVFFADCDPADAAWAASMLVVESTNLPAGPNVELTDSNVGRIPRVYVECLDDVALSPSAQRRMYTLTPCRQVYSLPSSHSPFLSMPDRLAECLHDAAARFANP